MCRIHGHRTAQSVVTMTAITAVRIAPLKIKSFMRLWSPAPKYFATGMPKPVQLPIQKPRTRNWTLVLAPTLASACAPSNCPTIAASMMLYVCCRRLPTKRGSANCSMDFRGLPLIMEVAM